MTWFRRHEHEHDYKPVDVQHINAALFSGLTPTTVILLRCSCSEVESKTIVGRWTLAQIRGEQEAASVD